MENLKEKEVKLEIDESIAPVVQQVWWIPHSRRNMVNAKLKEGMIEKVDGVYQITALLPSLWDNSPRLTKSSSGWKNTSEPLNA